MPVAPGIKITKASGLVEDLKPEKLLASLQRSGASKKAAEEIFERLLLEIEPYESTAKIYRLAKKYLKHYNHASSLRYSLKKALFRLGPTGYPFEKYFGEILKHYGYEITVGAIVDGRCVTHEIDVLAVNDNEVSAIECKYHNSTGRTTDVKVAMYVHSRFRDLAPVFRSKQKEKKFSGWLVTNTRCTSEAIEYAQCSGFKVLGWRHPRNGSLQKMIEDKLLYPVTIITGIKKGLINSLINKDIILLKDLSEMQTEDIKSLLSLPQNKAESLKKQADALCRC
jgi:Holliday junction resolvase-like predicted endonuclease